MRNTKWFKKILPAVVLGSLMFTAAAAEPPTIQKYEGISYVSGGIGAGELEALESLSKQFNLRLMFALKNGEFIAYVPVTIQDQNGNTIFQATSQGPLMFVQLPSGTYLIKATHKDQTLQEDVVIRDKKQRQVVFKWQP